MINSTGIAFADFAGISYLVQDGREGWVFSGDEPINSLIDFKDVPVATYSFYVLNKVGDAQQDRVDSKVIDVGQNMNDQIIFNIE